MVDRFAHVHKGIDAPASDVFLIDPDDDVDMETATRAIRAAGAGDVVLVTVAGNEVTCKFTAGETRPIRATRVLATGTTATGLEGMV